MNVGTRDPISVTESDAENGRPRVLMRRGRPPGNRGIVRVIGLRADAEAYELASSRPRPHGDSAVRQPAPTSSGGGDAAPRRRLTRDSTTRCWPPRDDGERPIAITRRLRRAMPAELPGAGRITSV